MENQGPLILYISSDEETGFADVRKSAGCEFIDREDVERLSSLLVDEGGKIDDDSDDVVFVSEVLAKTPKESRSESLKPLPKVVVVVDDDDDDCVVLDGDPFKSIVVLTNKVNDDDDLKIVGEKGEVACRDFPHPRHHCAKYPFASTPHDAHCGQCHCYVCDSLAPCSNWGTGANGIDHCRASDKEEYWKTERKHAKKGDKPKSDIHSKGGTRLESFSKSIQMPVFAPAQPNSLPENQALNPVTVRPCALSSNICLPNAFNHGRSQPSGYVAPRSRSVSVQSRPRSASVVAPKFAFTNKSYHVGSQNPRSSPPPGASTNNRHAYQFQSPPNRCPSALKAPVRNCYDGSNQQTVRSQAAVSGRANYSPSVPQISNPLPSQTVASYQSDAGNTPSTISTRSSPGSNFVDSGSSKLQEHSCPNSLLTFNVQQQCHTQKVSRGKFT